MSAEIFETVPAWSVTIEEAAEIMGLSPGGAPDALRMRGVKPCGKARTGSHAVRYLFKRADVERAAAARRAETEAPKGWCMVGEASAITGIGKEALTLYARQGLLEARKVPSGRAHVWIFRREALENRHVATMKEKRIASLGPVSGYSARVPSGYMLAEDFMKRYGMREPFFYERLKRLKRVGIGTDSGRAYPRELMEREFADVLPPGGYVDAMEARRLLGWATNFSGGISASVGRIPADRMAYKNAKCWYKVEDLLAIVERRSAARQANMRKSHEKRRTNTETAKAAEAAAAVWKDAGLEEAPERDLTTLEGLRERRAELCRRYRAE